MAITNGTNGHGSVEKEALAAVVQKVMDSREATFVKAFGQQLATLEDRVSKAVGMVMGVARDEQAKAVQGLAERIEQVRREASVPVNKNYVDTEPMAREVAEMRKQFAAEALERAKHLAVFKDMVDAVNNLPVPQHSTPVTVEPSAVDLSPLEGLVEELRQDGEANRQLMGQLAKAFGGLTSALAGMAAVNEQLLAKLSEPPKPMLMTFDEQGNATIE